MESILKYFPDLTAIQKEQFAALGDLYAYWNERINVVSRKDIENLYVRHVLHSLSIAKFAEFNPGAEIMDLGTGGGFPGIPLAIMYPETEFILVDSIQKKINVVNEVSAALKLKNVQAFQQRAEKVHGHFDFVVTRAVANLSKLCNWTRGKIKKKCLHKKSNGLIALKGGNLTEEIEQFGRRCEMISINNFFTEEHFSEKFIVYVANQNV